MEWDAKALYDKARLFMARAYEQPVASHLFAFWTSLALELLCRSALAKVHPVLLADPREDGSILYAFGIEPEKRAKAIVTKALVDRCSRLVSGFTEDMAKHCAIMADRRNAELHTGAVAFDNFDNAAWLPGTYEVMEVLLKHAGTDFVDFLGAEHASVATAMLQDRREARKKEVLDRISAMRKAFELLDESAREERAEAWKAKVDEWLKGSRLIRQTACPGCKSPALMTGDVVSRGPPQIDEARVSIDRELRVLPTRFRCHHCDLKLSGFQEMRLAGLGNVYTVPENADPIEFFGIDPSDYIDVDEFMREHMGPEYDNE